MLGDEAYASEREHDTCASLAVIRATLFLTWVLAGVAGAIIGNLIPATWLAEDLNLGFPASVVLMFLSASQLRLRLPQLSNSKVRVLLAVVLCALIAVALILLLGPLYFWIPSVLLATFVLARVRS